MKLKHDQQIAPPSARNIAAISMMGEPDAKPFGRAPNMVL
jgi:hypothetical protein